MSLKNELKKILQNNPQRKILCQYEEYEMMLDVLSMKAPCNFLVFGIKPDSKILSEFNVNGKTVFLEDDHSQINEYAVTNSLKYFYINYGTKIVEWDQIIGDDMKLMIDLPKEVLETSWDVIFIDGPKGFGLNNKRKTKTKTEYEKMNPGRMQSIYISSLLADQGTDVFVHDYPRIVEKTYADYYLGQDNLYDLINRMAHFKI